MPQQPSPNVALRLPPFSKDELIALVAALKDRGDGASQHDLVAVLVHRATSFVGNDKAMDKLAAEMRAQRARARAVGY
jgi:hypothetical protein